jgi:oxygen-dependent protoporphyrinogen oxidase
VVIALPTYATAELLRPLDAELARMLAEIPYAASATMSLAYRREDVPHPLNGFGFVVPRAERLNILGCTFTHVKWAGRAPEGTALLRVFLGEETMRERTDAELEVLVRADLQKLLGISTPPRFAVTARHPRSMAQYAVGHLDRVAEIERRAGTLRGLYLAGNGYRGIGIPDCIHYAEAAVERLLGIDAKA